MNARFTREESIAHSVRKEESNTRYARRKRLLLAPLAEYCSLRSQKTQGMNARFARRKRLLLASLAVISPSVRGRKSSLTGTCCHQPLGSPLGIVVVCVTAQPGSQQVCQPASQAVSQGNLPHPRPNMRGLTRAHATFL
jgi:hypothetical protein